MAKYLIIDTVGGSNFANMPLRNVASLAVGQSALPDAGIELQLTGDLKVIGNIEVSGLVDGVDISNLIVGGLLNSALMPALSINDVFEVASQAAMLALTAQRGDVAIRSDTNQNFILSTDSPGTLADWKLLLTPTNAVLSVAGKTGVVTLQFADLTNPSALLSAVQAIGLGTALHHLRVNAAGTGVEFVAEASAAFVGGEVYKNNSTAYAGDNVERPISWNAAGLESVGTFWDAAAPTFLVVPSAGWYIAGFHAVADFVTGGNYHYFRLRESTGSVEKRQHRQETLNGTHTVSFTTIVNLNAGNHYWAYQSNSGNNMTLRGSQVEVSSFLYRIPGQ